MSHAIVAVIITQFLMWLWLNHWIIPVTGVGYPFLGLYMSVYPAIFAWIVRHVSRHRTLRRWPKMVTLPIIWTGIEFLRGQIVMDGYPWYLLSHPLIEWPLFAQSADLFGAYFISFLIAMPAGFFVGIAGHTREMIDSPTVVDPGIRLRLLFVLGAALLAIMSANLIYGGWRMSQDDSLTPGPNILAIQTNLPQDNKLAWTPQQQEIDFLMFCDQTIEAQKQFIAEGKTIDLIAWPETMLPGFGLEPSTITFLVEGQYRAGAFAPAVQALQRQLGVPMLLGSGAFFGLRVVDDRWQWDRQYNSTYLVTGDPPYQRYDKFFLTPFGETMPYISNWPWLEKKMLDFGAHGMRFDLDSNPDISVLELKPGDRSAPSGAIASSPKPQAASLRLATPICFEDTVPQLCRRMCYQDGRKRADLLVNLSNDGWYNTSQGNRKLHAQIARFRCIENRVPMVRCVNTGLSLSIDSCGRVIGAVGKGRYGTSQQAGALYAQPRLDARQTLYGRVGEVFPAACLLATILFLGWTYLPGSRASSL